ncbi:MAG: hypothetical protein ABEJ30_07100 [Halorientalis sp.]
MPEYVVDIKPSARRTNGLVGSVVNRRGPRRRFEAREDAEAWAAGLSERGDRTVWVRAANPDDRTGADAYLVGRYREPRNDPVEPPGEQAPLPPAGSHATDDGRADAVDERADADD